MTSAAPVIDRPSNLSLVDFIDDELCDASITELATLHEPLPTHLWERALRQPLREFLSRPGKQFRAELVRTSYALGGGKDRLPHDLPLVVELLHAGSLIVDDIEDESPYRRGEPALHRVCGLPLALNTGNFLYFWPLALIERLDVAEPVRVALERAATRAILRCHLGQALDLSARITELEQSEVRSTVAAATALKAGSLTELAASLGALCAQADPARARALARFGREVGIALQMLDDFGSIVSAQRCAKGHEDLTHARPTWPWAWAASELAAPAFDELRGLERRVCSGDAHPEEVARRLRELLAERGRECIHQRLHSALDTVRAALGPSPVIGELVLELQRLEASYG
jgi:geranylgeranyl pyrophosphate synthase